MNGQNLQQETVDNKSLSIAFGESLTKNVVDTASEFVEIGLDSIMDNELLKKIPFVSTIVATYRIGKGIRERQYIAKLASFLNEINKGIADDKKRQGYREKFKENKNFRNKELEYILILIDRYISFDKPKILAKLYLAYLESTLTWFEFTKYAEIIDHLISGDLQCLNEELLTSITNNSSSIDSVLRLLSTGLVSQNVSMRTEYDSKKANLSINDPVGYLITPLGKKLTTIFIN